MVGVQFPTTSLVPKSRSNAWEDVRDLCKAYGLVLDPWQENVLKAALGERADGRWAATRVGLTVPRQNGKTALFEARELAGLLLFEEDLLIHSAHLVATALEGFDRIKGYFENYDDLRQKVRRVREANGEQSVEMMSGARLMFKARARGGIRGFSPDVLLLDEAQILSERAWSALLPAMSARDNPQAWLAGTPPTAEDLANGDGQVFTRLREAGHLGKDRRLAWMEWGTEGEIPNVHDRTVWAKTNPAYGYRISGDAILDEINSSSEEMVARERFGWWGDPRGLAERDAALDLEKWARLARPDAKRPSAATVVLDVSPDRSASSIGVAASGSAERVLVFEQTKPGTAWIVPALIELRAKREIREVALAPSGQAGMLIPELVAAGIEFYSLTTREVGQACAAFIVAVQESTVEHLGQTELDAAVANARTRYVGEAELWDRRNRSINISPLVAVSIAAFRWLSDPDYDVLDSIL